MKWHLWCELNIWPFSQLNSLYQHNINYDYSFFSGKESCVENMKACLENLHEIQTWDQLDKETPHLLFRDHLGGTFPSWASSTNSRPGLILNISVLMIRSHWEVFGACLTNGNTWRTMTFTSGRDCVRDFALVARRGSDITIWKSKSWLTPTLEMFLLAPPLNRLSG